MNCQQATRHIWDYCDNKLSPELGAAVESHCRECPQCNQHLQLTSLENEALKNTAELPRLSSGFTARVMKNLPEQDFASGKKTAVSRLRGLSGRQCWMAASTALLGIILVLLVLPGLNHTGIINFIQQSVTPSVPNQPEVQKETGSLGRAAVMNYGTIAMDAAPYEDKKELTNSDTSSQDLDPSPPPTVYSTDSSSVSRGTTVSESSPGSAEAPYNVSLPGTYTLVNISSGSDNSLIYKFAQDKTDIVVDVIVSRVESYKVAGGQLATPSPNNTAPDTNKTAAKASRDQTANSEISWTVTSGNAAYRLTLNGNLSPQELALLASSIGFSVK
ncbi:MAG: zf-HC2 domain-containing protein [Syntrophomonadaceae bacterium]